MRIFNFKNDGLKRSLSIKNSPQCDLFFTVTVLMLSLYGTVMVFSAGYAYAYARYDDGAYFMKRQVVWLGIGLLIMLFAS